MFMNKFTAFSLSILSMVIASSASAVAPNTTTGKTSNISTKPSAIEAKIKLKDGTVIYGDYCGVVNGRPMCWDKNKSKNKSAKKRK